MLASQLGMADIGDVKDNKLLLIFPASGENSKLIVEKTDNFNNITKALREFYKANLTVRFDIDKNKTAPANNVNGNGNEETNEELVEKMSQSPRIKMILEKVDGRIIGVKKKK